MGSKDRALARIDGKHVIGTVVAEQGDAIVLKVNGLEVSVPRDDVQRADAGDIPANLPLKMTPWDGDSWLEVDVEEHMPDDFFVKLPSGETFTKKDFT